jgi:hypothetical protein
MKKLLLSAIFAAGLYGQTGPEYTPSIGPPVTPITTLYFRDGSSNQQYVCQALSNQPTYTWSSGAVTPVSIVDSANTGTVTTTNPHGLTTGDKVIISGVTTDADLNGIYTVTVTSTVAFTITTANVTDGTYTDNTTVLAKNSIADATNTATVTTSQPHGLAVGNRIIIAGVTADTDLNGSYVIATVPSTTSFTITTANVTDGTYSDSGLVISTTAPRSSAGVWAIYQKYYTTTAIDRQAWAEGSTAMTRICDSRATYAYN